jgi:hypothetical protein
MTLTALLEIRLLGPFEVAAGEHPVEVSGSKRVAKQKFGPKAPQPSHDTRPAPARDTDVELAISSPVRRVPTRS